MPDPEVAEERAAATLLVVVHYGDRTLTRRALGSVAAGDLRPGRTVVVDNGPGAEDGPEDSLRAGLTDLPGGTLLSPRANLGFAGGVGHALGAAFDDRVRFVWLFNNDAVVERTTLRELLAASGRAADRALVSSLVREEPSGEVWFTSARFHPWWLRARIGRTPIREAGEPDLQPSARPSWRAVPYLPATSLLVPSEAMRATGGLDPAFFVYGEDVVLALRASRAGFRLVLATRSVVHHRTSSASAPAAKVSLIATGALLITARHFPWLLPFALPTAVLEALRRAIKERDASLLTGRMRGYREAIRFLIARRPRDPGR